MRQFQGGCHCGNITYVLQWPSDADPPLRKCSCSFCTRHGATYISHPDASLSVTVSDSKVFTQYQFGTRTANFCMCARCGVVPVVTSVIDGQEYAVANVNTLSDFVSHAEALTKNFDGETVHDRIARRRRTWIGDVTFTITGTSRPPTEARIFSTQD